MRASHSALAACSQGTSRGQPLSPCPARPSCYLAPPARSPIHSSPPLTLPSYPSLRLRSLSPSPSPPHPFARIQLLPSQTTTSFAFVSFFPLHHRLFFLFPYDLAFLHNPPANQPSSSPPVEFSRPPPQHLHHHTTVDPSQRLPLYTDTQVVSLVTVDRHDLPQHSTQGVLTRTD